MKTYKFFTYNHKGEDIVELIRGKDRVDAIDKFNEIYGSNWCVDFILLVGESVDAVPLV